MSTSRRPRAIGISRSPAYSPLQHATNDRAILEATLSELESRGWSTGYLREQDVVSAALPAAELYLNMCQGSPAARALLLAEAAGIRFFNRPSSVLRCHRQRLIPTLLASQIPFPPTVLLRTDRAPDPLELQALAQLDGGPLWLKRGGVHAERADDVRQIERKELASGLARFAARGIRTAAVQAHVAGPLVKFYGVASGAFFHAYLAESNAPVPRHLADLETLRALAFLAAARLKLDVFGGDVVFADRARPVLIDLNDWPSFAPVREQAARAIAGYVHAARPRGALR